MLLEHPNEPRHRGALLADRDIDAVKLELLIATLIEGFLIENGIDRNRGFSGLAVANDQLPLAAPDRDEGVDGLKTGGHGLVDRAPWNDAGRLDLHASALLC